jgi:hypothetical protein
MPNLMIQDAPSASEIFLAKVTKIYNTEESFKELDPASDSTIYYNDNKNFSKTDIRFLGAIRFARSDSREESDYAFPFDKNNLTYPIIGEAVFIIKNDNEYFWLPYTVTQYPNYREDYKTSNAAEPKEIQDAGGGATKQEEYRGSVSVPNKSARQSENKVKKYEVKEKIKFLKPKEGDTILQGRVGNTIRFSEFFLTEDDKTSSPSIFIRNKQNGEHNEKSIGTLVEEDINKDGSSIYIVSEKVKVPFKETIEKQKVAFKEYPTSTDFTGDQLFINSDRILLSAKAKEFIIFGKGNTGIITDGNFSIDAKQDIIFHTDKNITIESGPNNQIFFNKNQGEIYLGKKQKPGPSGSEVQKMVMGGELVDILGKLIDQIVAMTVATPCGPSSPPTNAAAFKAIKAKLTTLLSSNIFLSKT